MLVLTACAAGIPPAELTSDRATASVEACRDLYRGVDARVEAAGVADGQSARIDAFPYLRVERFFADLTERQIRRGAHRSTRELESAILDYIDTVNQSPRPFVWAKSADDILAAIQRFCLRTLESAENQTAINQTSESGH